jgi:hypothetical protein
MTLGPYSREWRNQPQEVIGVGAVSLAVCLSSSDNIHIATRKMKDAFLLESLSFIASALILGLSLDGTSNFNQQSAIGRPLRGELLATID